jgi:hypothetical protein
VFCFCINLYCLCCHDTGLTWNSKYKVIYWKMKSFSQLLSVFRWKCTNVVIFSLYLVGKSMWLHPIRKGIFNIKLGYYTCKRKVVIITYIIWVYCCGFEGSLLPWSYVSMFIYSCAISPSHYSKVMTPNIRACRWFTSGTFGFFHH